MLTTTNRSSWSRVDPTPIQDVVAFHVAIEGRSAVAARLGCDESNVRRFLTHRGVCSIERLDAIACALDRPELIAVHYPEAG
jgi:hypothetical protein